MRCEQKEISLKTKKTHNTLTASIGAGLEYYDFVIYALLSIYLSKHFFPELSPSLSLVETFGVFAVGYLLRPLGGLLFGHIGDRYGRKRALVIAMIGMALSTVAIGLLPTYQQIGVFAPILLTVLRMLQGLSFGAELPGGITFITEHAKKNRRGFSSGLMIACVSLGAMFGSLIVFVLNQSLAQQSMWVWGWRLPFWLGGLLAVVGFYLRQRANETPTFAALTAAQKSALPLQVLWQQHRNNLAKACGLLVFPATFIIFGLFMPTYAHGFFQYSTADVFLIMTIGLLWSALLLPLFGWLSDKIGRRQLFFAAGLVFIASGYGLFLLFTVKTFAALLTFMLLYETFVAALAACYFPLLAELFPTNVRYTGVAISYNLIYSVAGLVPMLLSFMLHYLTRPTEIVWFFIFMAVISLYSIYKIKTKDLLFEESQDETTLSLSTSREF